MIRKCFLISICIWLLLCHGKADAAGAFSGPISIKIGSAKMTLNGQSLTMDVIPFISNNRAYVQLLPLARSFNIPQNRILWDADNRSVMLNIEGDDIVFAVSDRDEETTRGTVIMDVPPLNIGGHIIVPVRYLAEELGYSVEWNAKDKVVTVHR